MAKPSVTDEAFDELYRRSRDRLAGQLLVLTGERQAAEDLVQEAFVRTWVRWDRVSGYEDPEGFVRRVAFNLARNRWRQVRRIVLGAVPPDHRPLPDPADSASDPAAPVLRALGELSSNERAAIALHHLAGLSVEEVAQELGAPAGTVKSWLSRGRAHLAERLEREKETSYE